MSKVNGENDGKATEPIKPDNADSATPKKKLNKTESMEV